MTGDFTGYEWLAVDVDHSDWWVQEACLFTFVRGMTARAVAELLGFDVDQVDGSTPNRDWLTDLMDEGKAIFDTESGWAVLYEDNGLPEESAERLAHDPRSKEAVMVFTNVNSITRFSHWREQRLLALFEFPDERDGEDPDELLHDMDETTGTTEGEYSAAMEDGTYLARMMKLAERVTGVHLGQDFLRRRTLLIAPGGNSLEA